MSTCDLAAVTSVSCLANLSLGHGDCALALAEGKASREMAAGSGERNSAMDSPCENQNGAIDRLKRLYPAVNEEKTPLPRAWSAKEKYNYIGLSQNNLRVHYKGRIPTYIYQPSFQGSR